MKDLSLTSVEVVKMLCRRYRFRPQTAAGQNFLVDKNVLENIVVAADLKPGEPVLEIGAGFGTLTQALAKGGAQVTAVELDRRLFASLEKTLAGYKNVNLVKGDIFEQWPALSHQFQDRQYKLISNLPYGITSLVLRRFLEQLPRPSQLAVMVQKEVAERVTADPSKMSLLSVAVQLQAKAQICRVVPAASFWPVPEIDSAILKLDLLAESTKTVELKKEQKEVKKIIGLAKIGFSSRRKQLANNLSGGLGMERENIKNLLKKMGISEKIRAQDISISQWRQLAEEIYKKI